MKWPGKFAVLGLVLVLTSAVSCTLGDSMPTEVPVVAESHGSGHDGSGTSPEISKDLVLTTNLLLCQPQPYVMREKTIGPRGGTLKIGSHKLEIPSGALATSIRITGEQVPGEINSVRFSPEGLRFAKPARLTLGYGNCGKISLSKRVVYTDELLKILELPPSKDYPKYDYVTGEIDHFSRYAVAY
jgi:hypothetical protein